MDDRRRNSTLRGLAVLIAGVILCATPGCRLFSLYDKQGFPEDEQKLTKGVRPTDTENQPFSVTERGRQIESNLGVGKSR